MRNRVFGAILFSLGLLVFATPRFILPVCEYHGFKTMNCSYTGISEMFMGGIIMASAAGIIFSTSGETLRWSAVTTLVAGVSVITLPGAIGYCHSSSMPCNYGTIPMLRLAGSAVILASLAGLVVSFGKHRRA